MNMIRVNLQTVDAPLKAVLFHLFDHSTSLVIKMVRIERGIGKRGGFDIPQWVCGKTES